MKIKRFIKAMVITLSTVMMFGVSSLMVNAEGEEASVTESGGAVTYYGTMEEAITAAQSKEGSTVSLLKDVTTESKFTINSGTFTINLNEKTWSYLNNGTYWMLEQLSTGEITIENGNITGGAVVERGGTLIFNNVDLSNDNAPALMFHNINDSKVIFNSGSVCATNYYFSVDIAKVYSKDCSMQINGGTFSGGSNSNIRVAQGAYLEMTGGEIQGTLEVNRASAKLTGGRYGMIKAVTCGNVDNLLGEGYVYRSTSEGMPWLQNTAVTEVRGVTVQQAPIQITAQPQGAAVSYGYGAAYTLSVTAQKTGTAIGEILYQWYKVKSGTETDDVAIGTNSSTYTLSKALPIATDDNYYCAVTCDGYTVNTKNVNFNVEKATPVINVNATISGEVGSRQAELSVEVSPVGEGIYPSGTLRFVDCTSGSEVDMSGATAVNMTDGKATYTWTGLADQIYKVKVVYSGDGNYNTVTSAEFEVDTIKKNQSALTIKNIGTKTCADRAFPLNTSGGSGNGAVTFTSSNPRIVSISGNIATIHKIGSVTITATKEADNTYLKATTSVLLTISKAKIVSATISGISSMNYTGKPITQLKMVLKVDGKVLKNGTDYTITYQNNKNIGRATVIINGKGSYTGTVKKSFKIKVSKGKIYTINNLKYKVTNAVSNGKGTVTLTGSSKSKSQLKGTLKICNTVKIGGKRFQITAIKAKAFKGYTKLMQVIIGKNVTTIGNQAFSGCKNLKTITIESKKLKTVEKNAFKRIYKKAVIKVPSAKVTAYKKLFKSRTGMTKIINIKKK
ncbi:leucine-rich repeat protein [Anaerosacchariphilus polymeriproducens]|uniref:Bacterial Ig-like domain-containing protein n=1 Tax=Anaerosacchariphilus polymeriproducens TaxID=1812858 RepID=A0A371AZ61_9FIRM|nr:leucine-rich repeat protein [Anaerosacchariphilus polymeriproducens]RDU24888.1 hypothetical protein DWV06_01260 [Anaerosacchariphilus polymeriproducens]